MSVITTQALEFNKTESVIRPYIRDGLLKGITITKAQTHSHDVDVQSAKDYELRLKYSIGDKSHISVPMINGSFDFTSVPWKDYNDQKNDQSQMTGLESIREIRNDSIILHSHKDHCDINYYRSMISLDQIPPRCLSIDPPVQELTMEVYTNSRYSDSHDDSSHDTDPLSSEAYAQATLDLHSETRNIILPQLDLRIRMNLQN